MRQTCRFLIVSRVLLYVPAIRTSAADRPEHTTGAFDRYVEQATETFFKSLSARAQQ
jgi:hypothetical protein